MSGCLTNALRMPRHIIIPSCVIERSGKCSRRSGPALWDMPGASTGSMRCLRQSPRPASCGLTTTGIQLRRVQLADRSKSVPMPTGLSCARTVDLLASIAAAYLRHGRRLVDRGVARGSRFGVADVINVPSGARVLLATRPIDFRKGAHGLAALAQEVLAEDPFCGAVIVWRSKRSDRVKILVWDSSGLVLIWKQLQQGSFRWPPIMDGVMKLSPVEFAALFDGLDWTRVQTTKGILKPSVAA